MNPKYNRLDDEDEYEYGLRLIETKVEQSDRFRLVGYCRFAWTKYSL